MKRSSALSLAAVALSVPSATALAGSHTWKVNEVFSNADGTIQFIELSECCGFANEINLNNKWVETDSGGAEQINGNVTAPTSNRKFLLATNGFAALPGAPVPDEIIADGFIDINGDTVRYGFNPPIYNYHVFTFGLGDLPTDGLNSIQLTSWNPNTFITAAATPTNYAACPWDCDGSDDGAVSVIDLLALLGQYDPQSPANCTGGACDYNGDGCVDVVDLLKLLSHYDPAGIGCP